jgi:beta-lactamase regulating signal transducer with metallopeptidase domain
MTAYAEALAWTLVHFVWQGAALALAAWIVSRSLRLGASGRYALGIATLALMLASPLVTFAVMAGAVDSPAALSSARAEMSLDVQAPPVDPVHQSDAPTAAPMDEPQPQAMTRATSLLVGAWLLGVMVFSLRLVGGWVLARRLVTRAVRPVAPDIALVARRLAARLALDRLVRIVESPAVTVPVMVGWLKPVILLPAVAVTGLTPTQLEAVIAHELAHVRRHDYLVNLLQASVETLLFYHPAVWWVSKQVREEREHCCDDLAVGVCDRLVYVSALTDLAAMTLPKPALAATGGSLLARVQRLLGSGDRAATGGAWVPALVALVVLGGVAPVLTSNRAFAEKTTRDLAPVNVAVIEEAQPTQTSPAAAPQGVEQGQVSGVAGSFQATGVAPEGVFAVGANRAVVVGAVEGILLAQSGSAEERARLAQAAAEQAAEARRKLDQQRLALERRKIELQARDELQAQKLELEVLRKEYERVKKLHDVGMINTDEVVKAEQRIYEVERRMAQTQRQVATALEELALAQEYQAVERTYQERLAIAEQQRRRAEIGTVDPQDARARIEQLERQLEELKRLLESGQARHALELRSEREIAQSPLVTNPAEPIRAGDVLAIEISGETDLPRAYLVQSDGTIRMPLLGSIKVVGLTVQQAGQAITKQIARVNPSATVHVSLRRPRGGGGR